MKKLLLILSLFSVATLQAAQGDDAEKSIVTEVEGAVDQVEDAVDQVEEQCLICLENLSSEPIHTLPKNDTGGCEHSFHKKCLLKWVNRPGEIGQERTNTCPLCRTVVNIKTIPLSIQDLIDHDRIPPIVNGTLNLSNKNITSLDGLQSISDIKKVTELNLRNNQITALAPETFKGLTALTHLNLSNNQLTKFKWLTALKVLSPFNTQITALTPEAFKGLTALTYLVLSGNQITDLTPEAFKGLTALIDLNPFNNQITALTPEAFKGLTALIDLNLSDNQITALAPETFKELTALKVLFLSGNQITALAPETFKGLTALIGLDLVNNQITDIAPGAFKDLTALTVLDLNQITPEQRTQITKEIPKDCKILEYE